MLLIDRVIQKQRFESLLNGTGIAACDKPLVDRSDWIVAPTLGAIMPGWLLVIPRDRALSFRDWARDKGVHPETVLADVRLQLGLSADEVIWFEHGPRSVGTVVGCGIDHAHLHVLIHPKFSFAEFEREARAGCPQDWRSMSACAAYTELAPEASYMIAGCGDRCISAENVEDAGSQYFRKVVSRLTGAGDCWDYRKFAHQRHIQQTIDLFRALEGAVQRGR